MVIIIVNVKNFLERKFCGSSINRFRKQTYSWKKAVLDTTILIHCKARQFLRDLFSTNQEKSLERALERAETI